MRHVYLAASKSKDPRTKIGAVLIREGVVISEGYNGIARGVFDLPLRYSDRDTKYKFVVHGEHNSILNAARLGIKTSGSIIYTQEVPCHECAKAIIQAGVLEVIVHTQWPEMDYVPKWIESTTISRKMFQEAGIPVRYLDCPLGLEGMIDGKKISV